MRITTIDQATKLPGTIWERDGKQREVTRVADIELSRWDRRYVAGYVYWKRPGGKERKNRKWVPYFNDWLSNATPVNEAARRLAEEGGRRRT